MSDGGPTNRKKQYLAVRTKTSTLRTPRSDFGIQFASAHQVTFYLNSSTSAHLSENSTLQQLSFGWMSLQQMRPPSHLTLSRLRGIPTENHMLLYSCSNSACVFCRNETEERRTEE